MKKIIKEHISEHRATLDSVADLDEPIEKVANLLIRCLENDGTIFWC
ncbi:MAG: phosphoheptose isomerase, partial [Nitrosomonadales bacterium]|nr:phosphoheptose isomerase [Nitrosomonadales bacterium]